MEWKCLENNWPKLYLSPSHTCEKSRIVGNEHIKIHLEAEECNCSERRWNDVSADKHHFYYDNCDILRVSLLKDCVDIFAPAITSRQLVTEDQEVPCTLQISAGAATAEEGGAQQVVASQVNYRPKYNSSTVSKVLERLVLARLRPYLTNSTNFRKRQSAFVTEIFKNFFTANTSCSTVRETLLCTKYYWCQTVQEVPKCLAKTSAPVPKCLGFLQWTFRHQCRNVSSPKCPYTVAPTGHSFSNLQDNSPTNRLAVSQVADWITRGLVNSPTGNF